MDVVAPGRSTVYAWFEEMVFAAVSVTTLTFLKVVPCRVTGIANVDLATVAINRTSRPSVSARHVRVEPMVSSFPGRYREPRPDRRMACRRWGVEGGLRRRGGFPAVVLAAARGGEDDETCAVSRA